MTTGLEIPNTPPVKILSFDPGTTVMGWAISEYDSKTGVLSVLYHGTIKGTKSAKKLKQEVEDYGPRLIALSIIEDEVRSLVTTHQPNFVASEDTFHNPRTPNAHSALTLCIYSIERMLRKTYKELVLKKTTAKVLHKFAPVLVKSIASGKGTSMKQEMIVSITNNPFIQFRSPMDEVILCEHEADAIAVGYTFAKTELFALLHLVE